MTVMSITAKGLAKKLNLSAAAVSMALNNKPGVSTATRRMVLDAADKYGYDFSKIYEKQMSKTGTIYFIIYKKHGAVVADTPFFEQVSDGILKECQKQDYKLNITYIFEDETTVSRQISDLLVSDCSGVILLGTEMEAEDVLPFLELPFPLVLLDTYFETVSCNCVLINNVQGAYLAATNLIRTYKTQPGYLQSAYQISNFAERSSGFYKAVRSCGMSARKSIFHLLTPSIEGAYADMKELIRNGEELARSYFADNDLIAIGAMKAIKEAGYRIPEDIAVIGFDNLPFAAVFEPALSTVNVAKQYMGAAAAQRLISLIREPGQPPVKTELATTLIRSNSG